MNLKSILLKKKSLNILKPNNALTSVFNVFNRIAKIAKNKSTTIYDNKFIQELTTACLDSGTARICIERRASYIYGEGFIDELLCKKAANEKQTFDKLLASISQNLALYKTVCLHVLFDAKGDVYKVYSLQVDKVTKGDGMFIYNPTLNTDYFDRNLNKEYKEYNPHLTNAERIAVLRDEVKEHKVQRGQILYLFNESIGGNAYCIPPAYSGIEDIITDHELASYDLENLQNGFMPSAILTIIGNADDSIRDVNGKTTKERLQDNLKSFTAKGEGRSKLLVMTASTKEAVPNLQQLDVGQLLNGLDSISDRIGRKICRLFDVPPVLAGFEDASILGSNQTFKNALLVLQHSVQKDQDLIKEALGSIYKLADFSIANLQLVDYIPSEVMAKLTDDELRAIAGYAPVEVNTTETTQTTLNALNTLSPLVANKVLESMSEQEIRLLVGLQGLKQLSPSLPNVNNEVPNK